jgi:D-proline reductase (dithiol) PrdB
LKKPLGEARIAAVTTAAYFRPDQTPFDTSIRGGDYSYRAIPVDTDLTTLRIAHRSDAFDISGIASDKNLALPLDRLKSLAEEGVIGSVAPRHFSFMGSIAAPGRLIASTAPEVARMLLDDAADAVLLTPV